MNEACNLNLNWPKILELNKQGDAAERGNRFAKLTEELGELADTVLIHQPSMFQGELIDVTLMLASIFGDHFPDDDLQLFFYGCSTNMIVPSRQGRSSDEWRMLASTRVLQIQRAAGLASEAIQIATDVPSSRYKYADGADVRAKLALLDALSICFRSLVDFVAGVQLLWDQKIEKWSTNITKQDADQ